MVSPWKVIIISSDEMIVGSDLKVVLSTVVIYVKEKH